MSIEARTTITRNCLVCSSPLPDEPVRRGRPRLVCVGECTERRIEEMNKLGRRKWRLRKYGITPADYDVMLEAQSGKCAICSRPAHESDRGLHIDHCHTTGRVRGLLCLKCNMGIGFFDDNPSALKIAARYLRAEAQ